MVEKVYQKDISWTVDAKQILQFEDPKESSTPSITLKVLDAEDTEQKMWLIHLRGGGMVSLALL